MYTQTNLHRSDVSIKIFSCIVRFVFFTLTASPSFVSSETNTVSINKDPIEN